MLASFFCFFFFFFFLELYFCGVIDDAYACVFVY